MIPCKLFIGRLPYVYKEADLRALIESVCPTKEAVLDVADVAGGRIFEVAGPGVKVANSTSESDALPKVPFCRLVSSDWYTRR